jgi:acyl-CoA thioester hydrolase
MTTEFTKTYDVRWYDVDGVRHIRPSAFIDFAADSRFAALTEAGLGSDWEQRWGVTLSARRDEIAYHSELRYGDKVNVETRVSGLSPDASGWRFDHELRRSDDLLCAVIRCTGTFVAPGIDQTTAPPPLVATALRGLARTADFDPRLTVTIDR